MWYIEGWKGRTRYECNARESKNLDEAIIIATNFETFTNERTYEVNNLKKQSNYKTRNNRGENRESSSNASIKCYNCNKIGHKANVCYNKYKNKKPWKKNEGEGDNSATPKLKLILHVESVIN